MHKTVVLHTLHLSPTSTWKLHSWKWIATIPANCLGFENSHHKTFMSKIEKSMLEKKKEQCDTPMHRFKINPHVVFLRNLSNTESILCQLERVWNFQCPLSTSTSMVIAFTKKKGARKLDWKTAMRTSIHAPSSHHQPANRHSKSETAISRAPKRAMSGCNVTQEHTKPNATRHAFVGDLKMLTLSTNSDGRGRPMTPAREDDNVAQEKGNSLVCVHSPPECARCCCGSTVGGGQTTRQKLGWHGLHHWPTN